MYQNQGKRIAQEQQAARAAEMAKATHVARKENAPENSQEDVQGIPVNGFQQIVDMLRVADPSFRESLLKRLAARDINLAKSLTHRLGNK